MESRTETPSETEHLQQTEEWINGLESLLERAEQAAKTQAKAADRLVQDHPYESMGIALGLGLVVGWLVSRK